MKCVGVWYMEAIRELKKANFSPERTVHVLWVPDEEIGGDDGMMKLIETDFFKALNAEFAMDEGMANPGPEYVMYYSERLPWHCEVTVKGQPGHGSQFIPNSVGDKLRKVIDKFMDFAASEKAKTENCPHPLALGEVNTINLTQINGGVQYNVVPDKLTATFDIRVTPLADLDHLDGQINKWCTDAAGDEYEINWVQKLDKKKTTPIEPGFKWWDAFSAALGNDVKLITTIFPASTDGYFLRSVGEFFHFL